MSVEHATSHDGTRVAVHDLGGEGPAVVFCHATGMCGPMWQPLANGLTDRYRCYAVDLRGHGYSPVSPGTDLAWTNMAQDLLSVIRLVSPQEPVYAVGHSMGGASIVLADAAEPGRLAGIWAFEPILFDANAMEYLAGAEHPSLAIGARKRRAVFESRGAALERYGSRPPLSALDRRVLELYVEHGFEDSPDGGVTLRCRPETEADVFELHQTDALELAGRLTIPFTLAISGDGRPPALFGELAAERHDNIILTRYPDLTHFGPLEAPERLAADVGEFLDASASG